MARFVTVFFMLGLINCLSSCSSPGQSASATYPQDPRISSPAGVPQDSSTSYFPANASANTSQDSLAKRRDDCKFLFGLFSKDLFWFEAPVLSNYYVGHPVYRFLWSPPFQLPV